MIVANTGVVPVDLPGGRSLAPGERAETVPDAELLAAIATGQLTEIKGQGRTRALRSE